VPFWPKEGTLITLLLVTLVAVLLLGLEEFTEILLWIRNQIGGGK
jgi:hypothetical protein